MTTSTRRDIFAISGCVNFPTRKHSTSEGGMVVKLVVTEKEGIPACTIPSFLKCCGGDVWDSFSEILVYSDTIPKPEEKEFLTVESYRAFETEVATWKENYYDESSGTAGPFLASILLGTTGWSGDFGCTFEDLTSEGKTLYNSIQALYPNATLHLLTFLDT